jgi:hypothetical protein
MTKRGSAPPASAPPPPAGSGVAPKSRLRAYSARSGPSPATPQEARSATRSTVARSSSIDASFST